MSTSKAAIQRQLMEWTHAIPADAARLLKAAKYNLESAVDLYYQDPLAIRNTERANTASATSFGPKLEALFDEYWSAQDVDDREAGVWGMDATLAWCSDLGVDPEDPLMLALAFQCSAKDMGKFDKSGWVNGWKSLRKDSVAGQREHVDHLRAQLHDDSTLYRKVYSFTFDYARGSENPSVRVLPLDTACALWDLLLPKAPELMWQPDALFNFHQDQQRAAAALDRWKAFMADPKGGKGRSISKDVWNQFLDFALLMDADFNKHDPDNDAWPSLIDAFVESVKG